MRVEPTPRRILLTGLLLAVAGLFAACVRAATDARFDDPVSGASAVTLLEEIWERARADIYPRELASRFDARSKEALEASLVADSATTLASVLNPFLRSLGVSHTRFFDVSHQGYYLVMSLFGTRDLDLPAVALLGLQLDAWEPGLVQAVLEGSPAAGAGVVPGDRIRRVAGEPFHSLLQWQHSETVLLTIESVGRQREVSLSAQPAGIQRALLDATRASARTFACGPRTIGYLHLWAGTSNGFLQILEQTVRSATDNGLDGFVLDLRDGFGGAWWPYLDPFYPDRSAYFSATVIDGEGRGAPSQAAPATNPRAYTGPLAVLINAGTRSGKESLAWQFRQSGRARLFGVTTAGAFNAGMGVFADRGEGYVLYLSVAEYTLNSQRLEGVGVAPHVVVSRDGRRDTPLLTALAHLGCPG